MRQLKQIAVGPYDTLYAVTTDGLLWRGVYANLDGNSNDWHWEHIPGPPEGDIGPAFDDLTLDEQAEILREQMGPSMIVKKGVDDA